MVQPSKTPSPTQMKQIPLSKIYIVLMRVRLQLDTLLAVRQVSGNKNDRTYVHGHARDLSLFT